MSLIDKSAVLPEGKSDLYLLKTMLDRLYGVDSGGLYLRLIDRFGTFGGVFDATAEELLAVDGMTERVASFFTFIRPAYRQAMLREGECVIDSEEAAARFATAFFMNKRRAGDVCVFLDKKSRVLRTEKTDMDILRTVGGACRVGADKLAVMCGRPFAGALCPTEERAEEVLGLITPLAALGIEFVDYIEYGAFAMYSLRRELSGKPPVIAAEHAAPDKYTAFDFLPPLTTHIAQMQKRRVLAFVGDQE